MQPTDDENRRKQAERQAMRPNDERKARLAERLRANLQRRKAQARSRRAGEAGAAGPGPDDGLAAAEDAGDSGGGA